MGVRLTVFHYGCKTDCIYSYVGTGGLHARTRLCTHVTRGDSISRVAIICVLCLYFR